MIVFCPSRHKNCMKTKHDHNQLQPNLTISSTVASSSSRYFPTILTISSNHQINFNPSQHLPHPFHFQQCSPSPPPNQFIALQISQLTFISQPILIWTRTQKYFKLFFFHFKSLEFSIFAESNEPQHTKTPNSF
jgi:hypothetical protein